MAEVFNLYQMVSRIYATPREETGHEVGFVDSCLWLSLVLHQVLGPASHYKRLCFVSYISPTLADIVKTNSITFELIRGMKEDLQLSGDDINYITAVFWTSYCTSMIPACYFLTRTRINIALPTLEVCWGLFTLGCAWAKDVNTIYGLRFFVGLFESCSFTGVIYVIGSWYKPGEITRRVALFFIASPLGTMFAGYLQAAAYTNLNNTDGLAGWQ